MNEIEKITKIYNLIKEFEKGTCSKCGDIYKNRNYYFDHSKHILLEIKKIAMYRIYVDGGGGLQKTGYKGKSRLFLYDPHEDYRSNILIDPLISTKAELLAIKRGIKYLKKKNIEEAIIYTDSQSSIDCLVHERPFIIEEYNILANKIKNLNPGYIIRWIKCRDQLADPHGKRRKKKKNPIPKKYRGIIKEIENPY